jgi:hypothetical protein
MAANTWAQVPVAASLDSLNPRYDPALNPKFGINTFPEYMSSNGWDGIVTAWCGACFDRGRDELLIPIAGGHADYAGNDQLVLQLRQETPQWVRRGKPSGWDNSVITNDQAQLQSGSTGSSAVLPSGTSAPLLWTGARDEGSSVDGFYVGMTLGTFSMGTRTITAYNGTTKVATLDSAWGGSGDASGQRFYISNGGPMVAGLLGEKSGRYSDGRARAVHTYNIPEFADLDDAPYMAVGGSGPSWTSSQGYFDTLRIDRLTGAHTFSTAPSSTIAASPFGGACAYDPTRGTKGSIWYFGQNGSRMGRLDVATKAWTQSGASTSRGAEQTLLYLPGYDLLLLSSSSGTSPWVIYDPAADTFTNITANVSGTPAGGVTNYGASQPCYVAADNSVYWWNNPSGSTTVINKMVVPASPKTGSWAITQTTPAGSNAVTPSARTANGTYGRFRYSSHLDGFVLLNSVTGPVYFYART